jgi:hypothetical protein
MCIGDQTHGLHAKPQSRSEGQNSVTEDILLVFVALLAEASVVFPVDAQVPCYQLGHQLRRIELLFLQLRRIELCALDNRRLHSSSVPSASNVSRFIVNMRLLRTWTFASQSQTVMPMVSALML